ncbi:urea amidolyase [Trichomonascus vanleenenianus]|uniref:bifunctional urea carboxylase/allophanate hydrolase n=1 Tax=Trichomonascus vanleenenianus TaxID=2268995 RepID=UPI003ECA826D
MSKWTIEQWRSHQLAASRSEAFQSIVDLVESFDSKDPAWISIASFDLLKNQWDALSSDPTNLPLYGVPFAVKDNIDVEGFATTAACPGLKYTAEKDATIVSLLKKAGAIVIGKTNLDQFATGLVGTRSPYGKPSCTFSDKHVSGGSSSGSASVVSRGLCPFALGTDTAGSGRVPAALNNLVGLKPTVGAFSCSGVVPACKSLDCVSIFSLNLRDAQLVFSLTAKYDQAYGYSRPMPSRPLTTFGKRPVFAVPKDPEFFGDEQNAEVFKKALTQFREMGAELIPTDFTVLYDLARILYEGPWVAERYSAIRDFMTQRKDEVDPVVYEVVKKAENFTASDFFDYEYLRKDMLKRIEQEFDQFDGLVVPTCPLNPTFKDIEEEPILVNSRQGTYTNFVNLGDMSALAIPAGFRADGLPQGITLLSKKFNDYALLDVAQRFLAQTAERTIGCTDIPVDGGDILNPSIPNTEPDSVPLAVVGGHLSGMALNWQLQKVDAKLSKKTTTARAYRLYALPNSVPKKPGLRRVAHHGEKIAVEVWNVPTERFGDFISMVPHPLGIGNVELDDGSWVKGFICEESGYAEVIDSHDITMYGGWKNYISDTSKSKPFNTVLVANRGEIAVRIIRTLKKLNIKAVAVFSEPDRYAQHVLDADDSVPLNGHTAAETYLSVRKIITAAKRTGCQAIIPGYGFLSENADFAEACEDEGIVFVGPSAESIRKLGLKHSAREIAQQAGVPLVPGSGLVETLKEAFKIAHDLEYPLMIKSTAGGGGIGLQRVNNDEELSRAFDSVKRQGKAFFNDSGVFLERFIDNARHVEVQVLGDGKGNAISLGERDCSLQRRNQKIIEETPAPNLPQATRERLHASAENLVRTMKYKNAGTVEFIYDEKRDEFYFLEVNARLQVEHPITEAVTGLDLVEWMLYIACDRAPDFSQKIVTQGAAMEARLYAENPVKGFLPSPGQITELVFPSDARVDTWISIGTKVSAEYDPTLAKIIVHGKDRADALAKLSAALDETMVSGLVSNIDYLRTIAGSTYFREAKVATKLLDSYKYTPFAAEVTFAGSYTTVQDYPGRQLLWHIGVPPSGPMDDFSHRLANRIVGNDPKAPLLECTLIGPSLIFHHDSIIALAGGKSNATVDGEPIKFFEPVEVKAGQKLVVGKLETGCRTYLAVRGGIDVPEYLGSRSTFALGNLGGQNGRTLKIGDILWLGRPDRQFCHIPVPVSNPRPAPADILPQMTSDWKVAVTCGPHGAPDFFAEGYLEKFFAAKWKVHYNSNRFGVRLCNGPKPDWARKDGGEAGLHPSNAHDYPYSIGAINFTGDQPVILTCDGPSLGGFVCAAVVVEAEMWKIGQAKPGDSIQFVPVSYSEALQIKRSQDIMIEGLDLTGQKVLDLENKPLVVSEPVLYKNAGDKHTPKVVYRQAGDRYILVEYGDNVLDLNHCYRVHKLTEAVMANVPGVLEMTPGVRSVLIQYDPRNVSGGQSGLMERLVKIEQSIRLYDRWQVPSRIIRLPMAFEDKKVLEAVKRYQETIKSEAPWLPNNVDFLQKINGFEDRNDVRDAVYQARYLVLGRGDVFLGAPCAVPLDPRHRLTGTKYNPARTYTPNGAVGIGGMYMCIYTMDSPGGYQLVGRTIPIWDKLMLNRPNQQPWLLNQFDQIEFYPVSEATLNRMTEDVNNGRFIVNIEESVFDYGNYAKWLAENRAEIEAVATRKLEEQERMLEIMTEHEKAEAAKPEEENVSAQLVENDQHFKLHAEVMAGRFWKSCVVEGDYVQEGQGVVILEAMKTEMVINAPINGKIVKILPKSGDMVETGDLIAVIEPDA